MKPLHAFVLSALGTAALAGAALLWAQWGALAFLNNPLALCL